MLCVIAKIDSASKERLANIRSIVERFGITVRELYGHITLATYIGDAEEQFVSSCKGLLACQEAFPVFYDKVEVFPVSSMIAASPRKDKNISAINKKIAENWAEQLNDWTQEAKWYPHTTLLYQPQADLYAIAEAMQEEFKPFEAWVERIEFSHVNENGYEIIDCIELR